MAEQSMKIVVITADGQPRAYPKGKVDVDVPMDTVLQDIQEILELREDYELYIKVDSRKKLSAYQVEAIAILPARLKPSRSVRLE